MNSTNSWEPQVTSDATARNWLRAPFGVRGDRTRLTRPRIEHHGHELDRHELPPLV